MKADSQDIIQAEIALLDKNGNIAAADDKIIYYQITGDAQILGIENGKPDDLTPYSEKHRQTHYGRAIVYIRAGTTADTITLHAYTKDGLKARAEFISR